MRDVLKGAVLILIHTTSSLPALAQSVTFADLKGATVQTRRTEIRTVRSGTNQNAEQRVVMENTIKIGGGGKLSPSLTITADGVGPNSTSATRTWGGKTVGLDLAPQQVPDLM